MMGNGPEGSRPCLKVIWVSGDHFLNGFEVMKLTRKVENESVFDHSEVKKSLSECLEGLESALASAWKCLTLFPCTLKPKNGRKLV